ncbi:MAG: hypothetical protein IJ123_05655 [Blautia sp.]|nr:hypothetical protein [Blautia sp.]
MKKYITRDKLGKKARRQLDSQQRLYWPVSPAPVTFESKKHYNRKRKNHDYQEDWYHGFLVMGK